MHIHTDNKSKSTIDHMLISPRLIPLVSGCGVVERGDNLSRHCPIWVKLRLGALPVKQATKIWLPRSTCWSKASVAEVDSYTSGLQSELLDLSLTDSHCSNTDHHKEGDELVLDILESLVKTSHTTLPQMGGRWVGGRNKNQGKPVPYWMVEVEPFRKASIYWGDIWRKEGRPSTGWLHDTYIKSRAQYHLCSKEVQKSKGPCQG